MLSGDTSLQAGVKNPDKSVTFVSHIITGDLTIIMCTEKQISGEQRQYRFSDI